MRRFHLDSKPFSRFHWKGASPSRRWRPGSDQTSSRCGELAQGSVRRLRSAARVFGYTRPLMQFNDHRIGGSKLPEAAPVGTQSRGHLTRPCRFPAFCWWCSRSTVFSTECERHGAASLSGLVMMTDELSGGFRASLALFVCSTFFGSAAAEMTSIGALMIPATEKDGYSRRFATASSSLSQRWAGRRWITHIRAAETDRALAEMRL